MKILLTNQALDARGGSESYLEVIAWELRRLEHEVLFFSPRCGEVAESLEARGYSVHRSVEDLPSDIDVIHGQHVDAIAAVRYRFPRIPLVFVTHSWFIPIEDPAESLGASAFVCFNALTEQRLRAHAAASGKPVVRLTQPISITFAEAEQQPIGEVPVHAVAVSRSLRTRLSDLEEACSTHHIRFHWIGGDHNDAEDVQSEMFAADIVFAMGRTALEAMAAGRAVFIVDESTVGGWMTASSYPTFEADGFTGRGSEEPRVALAEALAEYSPSMGRENRRLAYKFHAGQSHVVSLLEVYESVLDNGVPSRVADSMAVLSAENFALVGRVKHLEWAIASRDRALHDREVEQQSLRGELEVRNEMLRELQAENSSLQEAAMIAQQELSAANCDREAANRQSDLASVVAMRAEAELLAVKATLSWRLTKPIRWIRRRCRSNP